MNGNIDTSQLNTPPEPHELATAQFFAEMGKDIVFIRPSNIADIHTADFIMDDVAWETKAPIGDSKRTIENNFRKASKQSGYVIFDLRRTKRTDKQCLSDLKKELSIRKSVKRLLVITKTEELIEIN